MSLRGGGLWGPGPAHHGAPGPPTMGARPHRNKRKDMNWSSREENPSSSRNTAVGALFSLVWTLGLHSLFMNS